MTNDEFLGALEELIFRAKTQEGYLEYIKDDIKDLIEEDEEDRDD